jgi:ATP-binding cassette subfamily B protein
LNASVPHSNPPTPAPIGRPNLLSAFRRAWAAWRRISSFFRGSRHRLAVLSVVAVVAGLAEATLLALIATVATALSQGRSDVTAHVGPATVTAALPAMFGVALGLAVLRGGLQVWLAYLPAAMSAQAMAQLRRQLFDAFHGAAWAIKSSERDGQFQSLMNLHITTTSQAIITLGTGITSALMFVTLLGSALVLSPVAALILSVASLGLFLSLRPLARRLRRHAKALSTENIEYSKGVQEVVLMAEEAQVFGASTNYRESFYSRIEHVRLPMLRTRFLAGAVPALYQSVALLVMVLALVAVSLVDASKIAALGSVVLLLVRALTYGQQIQTAVTNIDEAAPFMNRLADAIERYTDNPQQDGPLPLPTIERMGMSDVRFSYVPGKEVLHGISFDVRRGEAVGIVGPSGAGKSSIVQLLLRLRDPESGNVVINGRDARELQRSDWQRHVAYVPQTPQLIWGTVWDNIRFYRPDLTDDDIQTAARRAHIHSEIESWPQGYDTVVGQRASAVSGGQRQRLCLARALAAQPDVLILDEPTSALDVRSEELVQESLSRLKGDLILFLVAHRLSTLSICDRVMVVVDGRLEAIDRPSQLLATNDFFRDVSEITRRQGAASHDA